MLKRYDLRCFTKCRRESPLSLAAASIGSVGCLEYKEWKLYNETHLSSWFTSGENGRISTCMADEDRQDKHNHQYGIHKMETFDGENPE